MINSIRMMNGVQKNKQNFSKKTLVIQPLKQTLDCRNNINNNNTKPAFNYFNNIHFGYKLKGDVNSHLDYFGANKNLDGTTTFRVFSTKPEIELQISTLDHDKKYWESFDVQRENELQIQTFKMKKEGNVFELTPDIEIPNGALYRYKIHNEDGSISYVKDPRSYHQPHDAMGWSAVYDQNSYNWQDNDWQQGKDPRRITHDNSKSNWGVQDGMVISEKHIGLLGGFEKAKEEIDKIAQEGICNTMYCLPVGEFFGFYNHGYDEVDKFAPESSYGSPDELKSLVDYAHQKGINMILDVVPNHFGFIGNPVGQFANAFEEGKNTGWGSMLKFSGHDGFYMRKYMSDMMINWLANYHFDGLRIDATEKLESDPSLKYFAAEIRNHPETKNAVLIPEHIDKTRKLAQPLKNYEVADPLNTYKTAVKQNLKADKLGYDVQYIYDFKNTLSAITLGIKMYDCPSSVNDLAKEYTNGYRFYDEESSHLPSIKANNSYVYYNMHDEYNVFGGVRPVVRMLAKQLGFIQQHVLTNPEGLDKTPYFRAEELLKNYLIGNYSELEKQNISISDFEKAYNKAQSQNRLMLAATFMHPGVKGFSMGDEVGELTPLRYFAQQENDNIRQAISKEKGYDIGESAFRDSSKLFNNIKDDNLKRSVTQLSKDFTQLINENPALKHGSYDKIIAEAVNKDSIFIHKWDGFDSDVFAIANFSGHEAKYNSIPKFPDGDWVEVLNTDDKKYDGSGNLNSNKKINRENLSNNAITLAPYSLAVFKRV